MFLSFRKFPLQPAGGWLLALCLLPFYPLFGQANSGELRLSVKDTSGDQVAATAELVSEATKTRQTVDLPATGRYYFRRLSFGTYLLTVTKAGFSPFSELIQIRSVIPETRDVTLSIHPVETSVEVNASQTLLNETRTSEINYTSAREIQERPMGAPGRGLIDLAVLQPGWTLEANGILHPRESEYDTQFVVNGFPVLDNRSPAFARPLEADDVADMKQYTSGIPAEFGGKLGGVIELNTTRNTSPGFHGVYVAQGGSFDTLSSYLSGQYVAGKTTVSASGEGFLTDRYLDPPTTDNYTNHASSTSFNASVEHDFNEANRLRVALLNQQTWLQVPDDLLQKANGQRQDRTSGATEGQVSYQHVFSPSLLGSIRGSIRDVTASLWSNPLSTPISASQDRDYREGFWDASLAGNTSRNEWKIGTQGRYASVNERFGYDIIDYEINGIDVFDDDLPPSFRFRGHAADREQAAYAEDTLHLGNLTARFGLRFDHYDFLVSETAWSPRAGVGYFVKPLKLVLHASYDRTFGTPPFENVLLSAAPDTRFEEGVYLPLRPSRGNYYEAGFSKTLAGHFRLDANWFRRSVRNFEDDDLLLNTGVSFPISFAHADISGTEIKLEVSQWGKFSGFLSYSNTTGLGQLPLSGGLFLDDDDREQIYENGKFPISQDIRNVVSARVRYQVAPRVWTAWTGTYTSGLPVEDPGGLPDMDFLIAQYGPDVTSRVNFSRGRIRPSFSLNASVGMDVFRGDKRKVTLQGDVMNLTDRLNVINFDGLLSGTAVASPRAASVRMRVDF